jgi:hypothetical protein
MKGFEEGFTLAGREEETEKTQADAIRKQNLP